MKEVEVGCRRDGGKRGGGVLIPIDWKPVNTCSGYNGERRTVERVEEVGCRRRGDVGGEMSAYTQGLAVNAHLPRRERLDAAVTEREEKV